MTSRPSLGQRQPPQRSLSSTNVIQRPPAHRTLSQQFSSSSPTSRSTDGFVDLTFEGTGAAQGRYGTMPRMGGSRLKLEISDTSNADFIESPKQQIAITPTWRPNVTPHARSQLHFEIPSGSSLSPRVALEGPQGEAGIKPMPLPTRPGQHAPSSSKKARVAPSSAAKRDGRPKPYILEVPPTAPRYPPNGHLDFFPWTGNHPEDKFSESVIRQGYSEKDGMTKTETGSAKPALYPALKHKSGLQSLSSVFSSILGARRAHGQITSASTFKPPPRVTVTDTKREMWLRDLANPTISLRRLSRSIPHGIRGKVLLDQSLSKDIPIERAVWLAKCVGANELRSFRRKGVSGTFAMGGEAKWIRDFTVCVEQFVESVIGTCGNADFRSKVTYAVRLAAHFHAEHLLDREHYLDWLVSSLENCPQNKLPLWILITEIYWDDLMQYRKYGRRLATSMMNHFSEAANHPDQDILAPITGRVRGLLKKLMRSHPDSFVSPQAWAKHHEIIQSDFSSDASYPRTVLESIDRRNRRLSLPGRKKESTPQQRIIQLLDTTFSGLPADDLPKKCWQVHSDKAMLLFTVLDWATSSYRPGYTKTYAATRICRFWGKHGINVTSLVLDFADSETCDIGRDKHAFYHLVSELARSGHFSVAQYLKWLVARGGLQSAAEVTQDGPLPTRLLAELPTHNLSGNILTLHSTLLERVDFSFDEEESMMRNCMASISHTLPEMKSITDTEMDLDSCEIADDIPGLISQLSRSSRSELGLWLRHKVQSKVQQPTKPLEAWGAGTAKQTGVPSISPTDFDKVRHYLELLEDYSMLADILKIASGSDDAEVLASCADTINLHIDELAAIGAVQGLFDILTTRLRVLASAHDNLPRVFLASLSDLAARIPSRKTFAQQLSGELALSDRRTAADACSPVSDYISITQTSEVDFFEEMEKILATGNSMDQLTLSRLFERISLHLESSWDKSFREQQDCGVLLTRLRPFHPEHFDTLMARWFTRFLEIPGRPSMMTALGPLVSFGCISLCIIANICGDLENSTQRPPTNTISQELVQLLLEFPSTTIQAMGVEESYRLRIRQRNTQKDFPAEVLSSIRRGLERASPQRTMPDSSSPPDASAIFRSSNSVQVLQRYALLLPDMVLQLLVTPLLQSPDSVGARSIMAVVNTLLFGSDTDDEASTEAILDNTNDLTLPFCQIKLESMFGGEDSAMAGPDDSRSGRLQAFDSAIEAAVTCGKTAWASIVPLLEVSLAQHLRRRSELHFLALFPSPKTNSICDRPTLISRLAHANNLLRIVDSAVPSESTGQPRSAQNPNIAQDILVTLNGVRLLLSMPQNLQTKEDIVEQWLPLLLKFITHHTTEFEVTKSGHEARAKVILTLSAILFELQSLDMNSTAATELIEQVFDLAVLLVDVLPDDVRQQCIRTLHDTMMNSQMYYLFSFQRSPSEWLVLSQKESVPARSAGESIDRKVLEKDKLTPFVLRRWEMLGEPTPNIGENDTSLNLTLFNARRG